MIVSYAQNFEDVLLDRVFTGETDGFYVDVGAWHPQAHSVTKHFYDNGWHGINLEPIRSQYQLFLNERPRDINLCLAAGRESGVLTFFECVEDLELSTFDLANRNALAERGFNFVPSQVQVEPLQKILKEHGITEADFLKIDVEGWENEVLKGIDFSQFRPRILLIESVVPAKKISDWRKPEEISAWQEWEPRVISHGYCFAYYDGLSRFYVRDEDLQLRVCFSLPAGVHDNIEFPELIVAREDKVAKEQVIQKLSQESSALTADQAAKEQLIQKLSQEISALTADQAAKEQLIQKLSQESSALTADQTAKEQLIQKLSQEISALTADQAAKEQLIQKLSQEISALTTDQAAKEQLIQKLSQEISALTADQTAKEQLIQKLSQDHRLKEGQMQLQATLVADLESDRVAKQRLIEQRDQLILRLHAELDRKLSAKIGRLLTRLSSAFGGGKGSVKRSQEL
jgi:FkbM family methyltransferase